MITDQLGSWKVNSLNQVLALNFVYDDEFVIDDSEGRIGCASRRTFENRTLCRVIASRIY